MTGVEKKGRTGQTLAPESDGREEFPAGMRVLAVDDDPTCLKTLESLLRKCRYKVTVTPQAATALKLLRESKDKFDIVISDVHMPDMDGFKLLEIVGLEMDLPVIMMSASSEVSTVMKGIKHGARDYLVKPIRIEELKNIWQHVIRKTLLEHKEGSNTIDEDKYGTKRVSTGALKVARKFRDDIMKELDADDLSVADPSSQKKQRVAWSRELHKQFISAVEQLGIENAVPKRILDLMNTPGLTRENVASHLQKYRKALKLNSFEMNNSGISSRIINCNSPIAGLESFDKHIMKAEAFQIDVYNRISDGSWFNNVQNPGTFGVSHANANLLPLLPNPQNVLLRYANAPEVGQSFHMLPNTGLGDASTDAPNYLSVSSTIEQLDAFTGLHYYIPGYNIYGKSLPKCAPSGHFPGMNLGAAESSCSEVRDGTINDNGAIALGTVQNSLPDQCGGPDVSDFQSRVVNADFGTSLKLESINRGPVTGSGYLKVIGDPDPSMNFGIDDMLDVSYSNSLEDLGTVVKQFHQWRNP